MIAQINVRITSGDLDLIEELRGKWIPRALLAREAMRLGLTQMKKRPELIEKINPRTTKPGPKPKKPKG